MWLKLDENLGERGRQILEKAGHEVSTVPSQGLTSASDEEVIKCCAEEGRALVTLDLDFANPLRFVPSRFSGVAILRLPEKPTAAHLEILLRTLVAALTVGPLLRRLWIVEFGRVRVYQEPGFEDS
jgi:predicted nuclease of predicted toxin-antitoxin system